MNNSRFALYLLVDLFDLLWKTRQENGFIKEQAASTGHRDKAGRSRMNKQHRPVTDTEWDKLEEFKDSIHYSTRYSDGEFEYRHVQWPKAMLKKVPPDYFDKGTGTLKLPWEDEWRGLGIVQVWFNLEQSFCFYYSCLCIVFLLMFFFQDVGWVHYEVHEPEPRILFFKRPLNFQAMSRQG